MEWNGAVLVSSAYSASVLGDETDHGHQERKGGMRVVRMRTYASAAGSRPGLANKTGQW